MADISKEEIRPGGQSIRCRSDFRAAVIGVSAGGLETLSQLFSMLSGELWLPIIFVQHQQAQSEGFLVEQLNTKSRLTVKEAEEKEPIRRGYIYSAPPDYHLLIERDHTFSLASDEKVNYSRPAIDVLFESAAIVYGSGLIGIILSGANDDGTRGIQRIKASGGLTIAQDPVTAKYPIMPQAAIDAGGVDKIISIRQIGVLLNQSKKRAEDE